MSGLTGYATVGYAVFPCRAHDKKPATENGLKDASTDPTVIDRWQLEHLVANETILPSEGVRHE